MRKLCATLGTAALLMVAFAAPASADTLIGVNACDINVNVIGDDFQDSTSPGQCVNQ